MIQRLLRQLTIAGIATVLGGLVLFADTATTQSTAVDTTLPARLTAQLNDIRRTERLPALLIDARLTQAAQEKANQLMAEGRFDHITSDGRTPWDYIRAAGYHYELAGENLAIDFTQSSAITLAWLTSPAHRANMFDPHFSDVGIATTTGKFQGRETLIVVELFGRPNSISKINQTLSTVVERLTNESATK